MVGSFTGVWEVTQINVQTGVNDILSTHLVQPRIILADGFSVIEGVTLITPFRCCWKYGLLTFKVVVQTPLLAKHSKLDLCKRDSTDSRGPKQEVPLHQSSEKGCGEVRTSGVIAHCTSLCHTFLFDTSFESLTLAIVPGNACPKTGGNAGHDDCGVQARGRARSRQWLVRGCHARHRFHRHGSVTRKAGNVDWHRAQLFLPPLFRRCLSALLELRVTQLKVSVERALVLPLPVHEGPTQTRGNLSTDLLASSKRATGALVEGS